MFIWLIPVSRLSVKYNSRAVLIQKRRLKKKNSDTKHINSVHKLDSFLGSTSPQRSAQSKRLTIGQQCKFFQQIEAENCRLFWVELLLTQSLAVLNAAVTGLLHHEPRARQGIYYSILAYKHYSYSIFHTQRQPWCLTESKQAEAQEANDKTIEANRRTCTE